MHIRHGPTSVMGFAVNLLSRYGIIIVKTAILSVQSMVYCEGFSAYAL